MHQDLVLWHRAWAKVDITNIILKGFGYCIYLLRYRKRFVKVNSQVLYRLRYLKLNVPGYHPILVCWVENNELRLNLVQLALKCSFLLRYAGIRHSSRIYVYPFPVIHAYFSLLNLQINQCIRVCLPQSRSFLSRCNSWTHKPGSGLFSYVI